MVEEKWQKAREVLERMKALIPGYVGPDNPYLLLAIVFRRLSDPAAEHKVLEELAMRDGDAVTAYLRLMELDQASGDWRGVAKNARRFLAVNPLVPTPHRQLARAAEHLGDRDDALTAYREVALLDDTDPAEVHYHLATLLRDAGKLQEARREVLKSLEEAPRFREAHQLLLEMVEPGPARAAARHRCPFPAKESHDDTTTDHFCGPSCTLTIATTVCPWPGKVANRGDRRNPFRCPDDRAGVQDWKVDEEFKKDVFTFVRIEYDSYGRGGGRRFGGGGFGGGGFGGGGGGGGGFGGRGGWLTDFPDSDLNFSFRLQQLTALKVNPNPINMRLTDEKLFDYPFIYLIEPGSFVVLAGGRRPVAQYLLNGGFLMVDDFWGQDELDNFLGQMKQHVFPEDNFDAQELPFDHEIFRCVYRLKEKPQVPSIHTWQWNPGVTWEDHGGRTPKQSTTWASMTTRAG